MEIISAKSLAADDSVIECIISVDGVEEPYTVVRGDQAPRNLELLDLFDNHGQVFEPFVPPSESEILGDAKEQKRGEVRSAFESVESGQVIINSVAWHGGFSSVLKLDGAVRLAENAGLSDVVLFDTSNNGHELTIDEAKAVVIAVGMDYQVIFARKQNAMVAIDDALSLEDLDVIHF